MSAAGQPLGQAGVRLAEVVAALSLATDLGTGHPIERSLRSCLLAVHFADELGVGDDERREIYYVALLRWVGCTADESRSEIFGDEIALGVEIDRVQLWNSTAMLGALWRLVEADQPPLRRAGAVAHGMLTGIQRSRESVAAHCEVAQRIADRLGFGDGILAALGQIFERWDGKGVPGAARGEGIARSARIVQIAMDAELFARLGGAEAVLGVLRERSGNTYDPALAARFAEAVPRLIPLLDEPSAWDRAIAAEPGERARLTEGQLDTALEAIGDFADLRAPTTVGHSPSVAALVEEGARRFGLPQADVDAARRAGLIHDVGMTGIPMKLHQKPGPLTDLEWERLRLHTYYTERILARPRELGRFGALAALHHERLDGSGYHRGLPAAMLPPAARLIAAADAYRAMIEPRPYRPAFAPEAAAEELGRDVRAGRLDGDAVRAILEAAGHRVRPRRREQVAGLTEREIEVLRLVARGNTKRQVGEALSISERTADHHIRHIYTKLGVSTRAAATLFAMQHHLVGDAD